MGGASERKSEENYFLGGGRVAQWKKGVIPFNMRNNYCKVFLLCTSQIEA